MMIRGNALRPVKKPLTAGSSLDIRLRALAFGDASRLSAAAAKIIELRPAYAALADHSDRIHQRAVDREHALHAFAVGNLAHREALVQPGTRTRDTHALEGLKALARLL